MASIFDRLQRVFKSAQNTNIDYNKAIYNYLGDSIVWNPENDDTYINKGYRYNPTIYSIVNLISKTAQTIPFQIYEVKNENDLKRYKALTSSDFSSTSLFKADRIQKSALVELQDTELHELLDRPNPAQSYVTWIQEVIAYGKLTGNRYIYGIGPETGNGKFKFKELYVLPSQVMEINSGGIFEPVKSYTLEYNGTVRIDAELICHIKDFNPYYDGTGSHLYGMSPLKAGLRAMDTNNEAVTTGVKYLQNQTARGVLMSDEGDLTETQAKELKRKFKQTYQGSNNAGDVIITPKKLSWVNFGLNASDLSLIEQYNASIKDLCNIYNVPVQLLNNTDSSTYNNMKEAKKALYQNAVMPELVKIREELNRWLTPRFGEKLYIDFDFTAIPELQEEMDKLMGVAPKEASPPIPEADLAGIRELTEMLPALRLLLRGGYRQVPPPSLPLPPQDPEEDDDAGFDNEDPSAQPQKRQPNKVEKQKPRDMRMLRRGGQPMPSPGAMHHVTMAQASVASQMGSASFEKVRTGAASSSGNTER